MLDNIDNLIAAQLDEIPADTKRALITSRPLPGGQIEREGQIFVDFASNDYLGLAHHPDLKKRSAQMIEQYGNGSGASRLVSGHNSLFEDVEAKIAKFKGTETALVMNSGFQANASVLSSLLDLAKKTSKDILLFTDKLNHASLHAGARLSGVRQIRYRHNDLDHLAELLDKHGAEKTASFIITESVFSMDGDVLDIDKTSELARTYKSFLYIDEAHATGVLGENGAGLCKGDDAQLIMGTFGKAMGSFGAYIACSKDIKDYLINHCPGFIYATALPPAILGAIDAALDLLPQLETERRCLMKKAAHIRSSLENMGFDLCGSNSQIIPVLIGANKDVLRAGDILKARHILCGVIRPPTVPPNTARLRLCVSAAHTDEQISSLLSAMGTIAREMNK